jgi:hypothetical protein
MNTVLSSSNQLQDVVLPAINTYVQSDNFRQNFLTDYPMEPMGFPFNLERCLREAERVTLNCEDPFLCSNPSVPADVRRSVCLNLPCAMILGSQQMGQCPAGADATPTRLHFPQPVNVREMGLNLLSATAEGGRIRVCFRMNSLEVNTALEVEFGQVPGVTYERMGVRNLRLQLDGPREVCMSAAVTIGAQPPVSDIRIETQAGTNFVSNSMIDRAVAGSEIYGLNYSAQTINALKLTVAPAMARQFRPTVEDAVKKSLAEAFEAQIATLIGGLGGPGSPTSVETPSDSFISELGVGSFAVSKYVDLMDCALLKASGAQIPNSHNCLAQTYPLYDSGAMRRQDVPTPARAARYLREQMARYDHVTSESLRARLLALESRMQTPANLANLYRTEIRPLANQIGQNQDRSQLVRNVGLLSNLGSRLSTFGVNLPEICDVVNPSPMRDRSIPNCPIQMYVDLNELNRLLATMYQSGRLCHRGRGDYVPELDAQGRQRYVNDAPVGTGCLFMMEEDPDGMRCFLNGPPRMEYDTASRSYKVHLATRQCFRGGVFLGAGKIGGDINFEIGFRPTVCEGGDFCLENGQAEWNVVPGTERFALRESNWLNGIVRRTIDAQLNKLVSSTIRLPLSSAASGPMSMVPLEAEGQTDQGEGYFGACLKVRD